MMTLVCDYHVIIIVITIIVGASGTINPLKIRAETQWQGQKYPVLSEICIIHICCLLLYSTHIYIYLFIEP